MRHEKPRAGGPTEADLRKQAEQRAAASEAVPHAPLSFEETARLLHELQVHRIDLEMQNEELRSAQAQIEAGQARYFDLYDLAPVELQRFFQFTLDGLSAHIAVLNDGGEIVLTNKAYRDFAEQNGIEPRAVSEGVNYLAVCDSTIGEESKDAALFAQGIREVLAGNRPSFELEYPCHSPDEQRWFIGRVTPLHEKGRRRVVVAHENITARKRTEVKTQHLTQVLLAIRNVNQLITKEDDPQRLIHGACRNLTETLGYHNAWIALLDVDGRTAAATADAGFEGRFNEMRQQLSRGEFPACMRQALERDATVVVSDPRSECADCTLARDYGERAGFTRQLAFADKTYGILAVSVPAAFAHDSEEQSLFDEVAGDIGFALHKIELQARLRDADSRVRTKLNALLAPEGDVGELSLADVLDVPAIQAMMDSFLTLTGIGVAILDAGGKVLVATGWKDLCTKFHRVHPETRRHCIESDTELSSGVEPGAFKFYRCKNDLWDVSTPIMLGGRHVGNVFFGQFFFEDETPDREVFRARARQYGFDEEAYLAALDRVPRWSRERVGRIMAFYAALARQLSDLSYGNIRLARTLTQRNELMGRLGQNEERLRLALKATNDVVWDWDIVHDAQRWNESGATVFGWTDIVEAPQTSAWWLDRVHPEDRSRVDRTLFSAVNDPAADRWRDEYRFRKADGAYACVVDRGHILRDADGRAIRMVGAMLDITERKRAEEAQRETSMRLQESVRAANIGLWDWDLSTNRVHFSREWKRQIGYGDAEIGDAFEEWESRVHPEDLAPALEKVRVAITGASQRYQAEFRFRHKDGSYRWIVAQCSVSRDETGKAVRVIGSHLDITEYKQVEEALRESEERFRSYVEHAPYGVFVTDGQGRYVDVNPAAERIAGYSAVQLTSMSIPDLLAAENRKIGMDQFHTLVATGRLSTELGFRRSDGSLRHWSVSAARIGPDRYLGFVGDITERKEGEARMAFLGRMLDDAPAAITIHDANRRFLFCNRQNVLLHGYDSEEEFLSINLHELDMPGSEALLAERIRQVAEGGEARFEVTHRRKDGSTFPLDVTAKAIEWRGQPAVLSIAVDTTERKRAGDERAKLQAQFLQAQKMEAVGRLAGGVAHDFNNMLMGILGYAELCRDEVGPEHPTREWLDEITHGAERSANLTRQLLAFARKQTIAPQVMNLNDGVEGMLKMLRHLIGEDKELAWQPGAGLWSVKIDPGQIDQILANLCLNARDAIGGVGRIAIETQNATIDDAYCAEHAEAAPGDYVMLAVSDNGCGMDADTLEHIFEPFFTTKGVGEGTGLGLATVYGIVKQNRGIVNVYSEPGEGTTLRIYLPRFEEVVGTAKAPEKESAPPGGTETILLVEDEQSVRVITALALERLGYDVMTAATPDEALRKVAEKAGAIHLLITDVVMPGMSGRDLAAKLSALRPLMKCLFISGYTADSIAQRGILDEGIHFLAKPFNRDDLARKVRRVLRRERGGGADGHGGARRMSDTSDESDMSDEPPPGASR